MGHPVRLAEILQTEQYESVGQQQVSKQPFCVSVGRFSRQVEIDWSKDRVMQKVVGNIFGSMENAGANDR